MIFFASALGVIPTAALMGRATEELAARSGPGIGGLLNVTFGNAPELIIAFFALHEGLQEVVKASLVGSILGNVLLVMGASMLVGGLKRERQNFNRTAAGAQSLMLLLAVRRADHAGDLRARDRRRPAEPGATRATASRRPRDDVARRRDRAALLLRRRACSSRCKTHRDLFNPPHEDDEGEREPWSVRRSVVRARGGRRRGRLMSEILVGSIEEAVEGDRAVAVLRRRDRRGDRRQRRRALGRGATSPRATRWTCRSRSRSARARRSRCSPRPCWCCSRSSSARSRWRSSSTGWSWGRSLLAVLIANFVTQEGESTWFEGVQLLAVYAVLALTFFFVG